MSTTLATVTAWDPASGTGAIVTAGGSEYAIGRDELADPSGSGLGAGQRVVFELGFERAGDDWQWTTSAVRSVDDDEAAVIELDLLCNAYAAAVDRSHTAGEVASDDSVASAQERVHDTAAAKQSRIPEIGAALHARGGTPAMIAVLDRVAPDHRAEISRLWTGIGGWSGSDAP